MKRKLTSLHLHNAEISDRNLEGGEVGKEWGGRWWRKAGGGGRREGRTMDDQNVDLRAVSRTTPVYVVILTEI